MSEHPRDDEELQAFLSGDSGLSRRYREVSDEQPPAHVDAAILAASRWAVGADRKQSARRSADASVTDQHHADVRTRGSRLTRWSVPLAMAAVVVVAVTLTFLIERDPEMGRIDEPHVAGRDMAERQNVASVAEGEATSDSHKAENQLAAPQASAPPVPAPPVETTAPPVKVAAAEKKELQRQEVAKQARVRTDQGEELTVRKTDQVSEQDALAGRVELPADSAVALTEEPVPARPAPAPSAEARSPDSLPSGIEAADESEKLAADMSRPEDSPVAAGASEATAMEEVMSSAATTPEMQQSFVPAPGTVSETASAEPVSPGRVQPGETAADATKREPAQWVDDIEELLSQGKREEAIDSLKAFRLAFPGYELPVDLLSLLPSPGDE